MLTQTVAHGWRHGIALTLSTMPSPPFSRRLPARLPVQFSAPLLLVIALVGCGGGTALDNAPTINNPGKVGGQKLSFAYFARCVNPVLVTPLPTPGAPAPGTGTNTCAAGGCHDNITGTGGALRLVGGAVNVNLAATPEVLRASDMYKNYYSALGSSTVGAPEQSAMLNKPLVRGVLHGGGVVFGSAEDQAAKTIRYWINRPMPDATAGDDEFSSAANSMFTPPDAATGVCNIN
jgi:hypothetical protein